MAQQQLIFNSDLIRRYDTAGPRYTSYPTAVQFHSDFTAETYRHYAKNSNQLTPPLSLYFHIPFCDTLCFYCACNKIATKDRSKVAPYLSHLSRELELQSELFDAQRMVTQLHWGGGTPTFMSHQEMETLMNVTARHFRLLNDDTGEYSIEIDPREADLNTIRLLRALGFNRLSLGVQDFNPDVQKAVNRLQTEKQTFDVLNAAREQGFKSISIDLIYGLPLQTVDSFSDTVKRILTANPDRISVFNYAHLPHLFKPQRRINENDLPSASQKLLILQNTIELLTAAGYVYIGMDHFAKPDDELAIAQRNGTLYRNFQGYATHADCDLIGLGITSIGKVGHSYSQNYKTLEEYYAAIDAGQLAIFRGIGLTNEDVLRREVITQLICHFELEVRKIEQSFNIDFQTHFAQEWHALASLQADGLVDVTPEKITVLPAGRLLVRHVCMVFDAYLPQHLAEKQRFSKVI
ncbi:oxygen-independent coproporphyrinogen III oxidase [Thioflexithrix psekupsensis]|uniref:Coproporphyrinogen-III oxidase n=1 Tax=Thioflexithrix psekupsensis TaxID=1570016 RepID=A0A251X5W2_9GAMM|nr:oxygen-independent coproporphyrinogen III oxidase [Thioflexithrix psekupsensis]OUD12589.1 oxygen-independent coproporphyrinogen III oxidase [Thioflexithrix psekupsensis]